MKRFPWSRAPSRIACLLVAALLGGCAAPGDGAPLTQGAGAEPVEDLYIVDCLLPGQVRKLGSMTYLSPRRPLRTTAADCRLRGGEYVAYDRADYGTALKVWLAEAEEGDAEAQTYVGEIFEKGLGQAADPAAAAHWYRRAAEQGHARAQINLGYLHEHGLGVEKDLVAALNWYRRAAGVEAGELVLASQAQAALSAARAELEAELGQAREQAGVLAHQLAQLQAERDRLRRQSRDRAAARRELAAAQTRIEALQGLYARAERERQALDQKLAALPQPEYRSAPVPAVLRPAPLQPADPRLADGLSFGRYFALIIGSSDYLYLDDLRSPVNDARRMQALLERRYGFSTRLLLDADEKMILNALNDLYSQIGPQDNLLIYYAGHGNLTEGGASRLQRGYWLPVDAQAERSTHWISNAVISDHLDRLRARSVLVIADSCYAGDLASQSSPFLLGVNPSLSRRSIELGLSRRARVVLSSGGTEPVLDGGDGEHSVFAASLLDVLAANDRVVSENLLFAQVAVNVRRRGQAGGQPEMRPIRAAGHGGGSFYFVPRAALN